MSRLKRGLVALGIIRKVGRQAGLRDGTAGKDV